MSALINFDQLQLLRHTAFSEFQELNASAPRLTPPPSIHLLSCSCPTDDGGDVVLGPSPAFLTCRYTLLAQTPEPGVMTAVALIGEEMAAQRSSAAGGGSAPKGAPSGPQQFSFVDGDGSVSSRIGRRGNGECASLFGSFSAAPKGAAKTSGSFITPNSTTGSVPPSSGPGLQLCQAESRVRFNAVFKSLDANMCNSYQVVYAATLAPASSGRGTDESAEIIHDSGATLLLTGCPASATRAAVTLGPVTRVNATSYTWQSAVSLQDTGGSGRSSASMPNDRATQLLLAALAGNSSSGIGRSLLDAEGSEISDAAAQQTVSVPVGQTGAASVRATFTRKVASQEYRLSGSLSVANPGNKPLRAGSVSVAIAFDDGSAVRVPAACSGGGSGVSLQGSPASVNCTWQLDKPLKAPKPGRIVALVSGPSPAAMSKVVPFSFAAAKTDDKGSCAAVSATWSVEGANGSVPQPKNAGRSRAAPSSAVEICDSRSYNWNLTLGPIAAQQCGGAPLQLVGSAWAQPTSGEQAKQAASSKVRIALGGCPGGSAGAGSRG